MFYFFPFSLILQKLKELPDCGLFFFFTTMCNASITNDEVASDVIRYVRSSQDLLTNMPFALFPPDEGMKFVSAAGVR